MHRLSYVFGAVLLGIIFTGPQLPAAPFINLSFEYALLKLPTVPSGQYGDYVTVADGLPGWTAYLYGGETTFIYHNCETLDAAGISVLGPQWDSKEILQGRFSVLLKGQFLGNPGTAAAIAQTGQIPSDAKSITFYATQGSPHVTFNNHQVSLVKIGAGNNYDILGGDISDYAGQTGVLRFTAIPSVWGGLLDNIQFSPNPVPEPGVTSLILFGGIGLLVAARRRLFLKECKRHILLSIAAIGIIASPSLYGQGTIRFENNASSLIMVDPDDADGPIPPTPATAGFTVGFYCAAWGVIDSSRYILVATAPLGVPIPGRFVGGTISIPWFAPGSSIAFQIRAWTTTAGGITYTSYEQAVEAGRPGVYVATSAMVPFFTTGGPGAPNSIANAFPSFTIFGVPEPSTAALGLVGLCALCFLRHNRQRRS